MPHVSVIVITKNNADTIEECIKTLLTQTLPHTEYELIFVDGCSSDGTDDKIEKYASQYGFISILHENYGKMGYARNLGIGQSRGNVIVFTDGDALLPKEWLENIVKCLMNGNLDAVGGLDILVSESKGDAILDTWRRSTKMNGIKAIPCIKTVNLAIRKSSIFACDGFDANLSHWDETELLSRLIAKKKTTRILYDPDIFVYHKRQRSLHLASRLKKIFRKSLTGTSVLMRGYVIKVALANPSSTVGLSFLFVPFCLLIIPLILLSVAIGYFAEFLILCLLSYLAIPLTYSVIAYKKAKTFSSSVPFLLMLDIAMRFAGTFLGLIRWLVSSKNRSTNLVQMNKRRDSH